MQDRIEDLQAEIQRVCESSNKARCDVERLTAQLQVGVCRATSFFGGMVIDFANQSKTLAMYTNLSHECCLCKPRTYATVGLLSDDGMMLILSLIAIRDLSNDSVCSCEGEPFSATIVYFNWLSDHFVFLPKHHAFLALSHSKILCYIMTLLVTQIP